MFFLRTHGSLNLAYIFTEAPWTHDAICSSEIRIIYNTGILLTCSEGRNQRDFLKRSTFDRLLLFICKHALRSQGKEGLECKIIPTCVKIQGEHKVKKIYKRNQFFLLLSVIYWFEECHHITQYKQNVFFLTPETIFKGGPERGRVRTGRGGTGLKSKIRLLPRKGVRWVWTEKQLPLPFRLQSKVTLNGLPWVECSASIEFEGQICMECSVNWGD